MLTVETHIGRSEIHGIGLFAARPIKKGEKIWEYTEGFDITTPEKELVKLSETARKQFLHYAYRSKNNNYVLCCDDARFLNHSDAPNLIDDDSEQGFVYTARDIENGEELTTNYRTFDLDHQNKLRSL